MQKLQKTEQNIFLLTLLLLREGGEDLPVLSQKPFIYITSSEFHLPLKQAAHKYTIFKMGAPSHSSTDIRGRWTWVLILTPPLALSNTDLSVTTECVFPVSLHARNTASHNKNCISQPLCSEVESCDSVWASKLQVL